MDKSHHDSTTSSSQYLKQLNKLSHKISKPTTTITIPKRAPSLDPQVGLEAQSQPQSQSQPHQPPVYNINKNEFRDVVQKLTGSPAHQSLAPVPTLTNPHPNRPGVLNPSRPPSSRLQRIRPPPLAHVSNRPRNLLSCAPVNNPQFFNPNPIPATSGFILRHPTPSGQPLSPLPPLPAVHAAAESPVSAYMRYLRTSMSWMPAPSLQPPMPPPLQPPMPPPPPVDNPQQAIALLPQLPTSPVPFGCMNSPRAAAAASFPMLSPGILLSPSPLPLSPTVPLTSPKWRGL